MRVLSLFTGAGGGVLADKILGHEVIGYVEYNDYCQRILKQRINEGYISEAPIFGDIRTFISEGYAESYKGLVDIVSAGFPCQPFSVAGKGEGENDERNMWPATRDAIDIIRPEHAFLENVPGLLNHKYIERIFGELAEIGYNASWDCISAADAGAPHKRNRLWILANSECVRPQRRGEKHTKQERPVKVRGSKVSNPGCQRSQRQGWPKKQINTAEEANRKIHRVEHDGGWPTEPRLGRVANGEANRVDRLKAIGNGQVPRVAATAWRVLNDNGAIE